MYMRRMAGLAAVALMAAPAATALTSQETGTKSAGERAEYSFRVPLDNGRGVMSLEDLRGKPVLIDFWGTR
jgi:cytochrome oxidase Cu insertion factor (SCO1/SenC/PrrC family)